MCVFFLFCLFQSYLCTARERYTIFTSQELESLHIKEITIMKHLVKFGLIALIIAYWIMPIDFMIGPVDDVIIALLTGCASKKFLKKAK